MVLAALRRIFLEILEPPAKIGLPLEIDVYAGGSGTMLATLENAWDGAYQAEMNEVGAGRFVPLRSDPKAWRAILAKGNLVKMRTGGIYPGILVDRRAGGGPDVDDEASGATGW